jgi:hypothetical protein
MCDAKQNRGRWHRGLSGNRVEWTNKIVKGRIAKMYTKGFNDEDEKEEKKERKMIHVQDHMIRQQPFLLLACSEVCPCSSWS